MFDQEAADGGPDSQDLFTRESSTRPPKASSRSVSPSLPPAALSLVWFHCLAGAAAGCLLSFSHTTKERSGE